MKAMKYWKKSIKHKSQPLLAYLNTGALKENDVLNANSTLSQDKSDPVHLDMSSAFKELESRLLSSLQEVITSSIGSFKISIESEISSLHTKVSELTDRI